MENKLIELKQLSKSYGSKPALRNVDLTLNSGKIVALLGPNGSGKTTLIKILNGLLKDYSGSVQIDGKSVGPYTKSIVSYLPDESYFSDWMRGTDALSIFSEMYEDFDVEKAMILMKRLNLSLDQRIKSMSKGQKEKFQLALVMSRKAKIYILDEPIAGVDPAARELILDIILGNYDEDALVLLSTHLITDIEKVFDEVVFIKEGEVILHENAEELRQARSQSVDEIFREEFKC